MSYVISVCILLYVHVYKFVYIMIKCTVMGGNLENTEQYKKTIEMRLPIIPD